MSGAHSRALPESLNCIFLKSLLIYTPTLYIRPNQTNRIESIDNCRTEITNDAYFNLPRANYYWWIASYLRNINIDNIEGEYA